jgi:elongation factor P
MIDTSDFKNGLKIAVDGFPCQIIEFQHVKPGKGGAFVKTKYRNLLTGAVVEKNFRAGEKFEKPDVQQRKMQYLYHDGDEYHFMDQETYDQLFVGTDVLGGQEQWLQENVEIDTTIYEGKVISVELPQTVDLRVDECPPAFKGDTAQGSGKPAQVETGATVQVPYFIEVGDVIRVDTRTGKYVTRA